MTDQPLEQNEQNITRFRPDHRGGLVRFFRTLSLLGMLACVLFGIWRYQDDLTIDNLRRFYQYFSVGEQSADFSGYTFESGLSTVYVPFGRGLAVASGDTYHYVSGLGGAQFSIQLKYSNPMLSAGSRYVLIYDLGNYGLCVANSYAEYLNVTLDSPILAAQMNKAGAFAVVTNEQGYRAAVTVYSARQRVLCKWSTSQYYVRTASVSPDSDRFAALCVTQDGLSAHTQALIFTIGRQEPDATVDLGDRRVYAMCHDKSGALLILCSDGLDYYDADGKLLGQLPFTAAPASFFMAEGEEPLLAFSASDAAGQRTLLVAAGKNGKSLWSETAAGTLRGVWRSGDIACALMGDRLLLRDLSDADNRTRTLPQSGARAVLVREDGNPILIYSDRAEKVDMEDDAWS